MDRLDTLRAFLLVAEYQSFAEAARRLRWSAAAATRAIAQLEDELGVTLFHRTTRSVKLTERGTIFLGSARQILQDLDDAHRRVRGDDAQPRGHLEVAAPFLFGKLHVLPIVARMLQAFSELSVNLSLSDRVVHLVEEGVDVAVRIGALDDSALKAVKVGDVRRVTVASPAYLSGRPPIDAPRDLSAHDIITFEGVDATDDWKFGDAAGTSVRVEPRLRVNTADAAIAACINGLGITRVLSYQVVDALSRGDLILLLEDFAPAAIPVHIIYPPRRVGSPNVNAFVKMARDHFRAQTIDIGAPARVTAS